MEKKDTALLIIDMQRDFVQPESPLHVAGAAATVPAIARLLAECRRRRDVAIFHIVRSYEPDGCDVERCRRELFQRTPCMVRGTAGTEIMPELAPLPEETVIVKPRFSAFFHTKLDLCLRALGVDHLLIAGTQYPNCIRGTVTDALSHDYRVTVVSDCCSAKTPEVAAANLTDMANLGARCLTLEEWLAQEKRS
ncbi:MAG: isochorismatase family cysteine hydrolase [Victivallales bacterium]